MERKEAIEVIKKNYPDSSFTMLREALETLIPELKESEDESIRKGIIEYLEQSQFGEEHYQIDDDIVRNYIAWLEKQKPVEHFELKAGHWYFCHQAFCCRADDLTVKEGERFMCEEDGVVKGFVIKHPEKYFVEINAPESQDEKQKPVDKVEPKFKVGDWVVGEENTCKIVDVIRSFYKLCFQDGKTVNVDIPYVDEKFHLWTIQDAKDGDVLTYRLDNGKVLIMIYESLGTSFYGDVDIHALLDGDYFSESAACVCCKFMELLTPATKEQRDLLFEKMKEAGYKWDSVKKELGKIENVSAWSEEDENRIMKELLYNVIVSNDNTPSTKEILSIYGKTKEDALSWLEKQGEQSYWKPSEEQLQTLHAQLNEGAVTFPEDKRVLTTLYENLMKIN